LRKVWILLPVLGAAGYFAFFGGEYSWLDLRRLARERQAQERAVQATRQEVKVLRARADSLARDSLALERLAREKYGLIRDGERLYRFADGATEPAVDTPAPAGASAAPRDSTGARGDGAPKTRRRKP